MLSDGPITEAKLFRERTPFGFTIAADMEWWNVVFAKLRHFKYCPYKFI